MGAPYSRKSSPVLATENLITGLGITPNPIVFCAFPTNTSRRIDGDLETYNFLTWRFYPSFIVQNIQPTLLLHLKLVPGDTSFVPDHYGFNKSHTFDYIKSKTAPTETFFGTPSYGRMSWNELSYRPPGTFEGAASDAGFFLEDGIPMYGDAGDYRIVAAALKAGGDENKLEDYDTWMSGVMRFSGVHSWEV
jgi:hypothetical protein